MAERQLVTNAAGQDSVLPCLYFSGSLRLCHCRASGSGLTLLPHFMTNPKTKPNVQGKSVTGL